MIFNIFLSALTSYLIANRWRTTGAAVIAFLAGTIIGWIVGGIIAASVMEGSPTQAALVAMSQGIWFSLAGAGLGIWFRQKSSSQASAAKPQPSTPDRPADNPNSLPSAIDLAHLYLDSFFKKLPPGITTHPPSRLGFQVFILGICDKLRQVNHSSPSILPGLYGEILSNYEVHPIIEVSDFIDRIGAAASTHPEIAKLVRMGAESIAMFAAKKDVKAPMDLFLAPQIVQKNESVFYKLYQISIDEKQLKDYEIFEAKKTMAEARALLDEIEKMEL